MAKKIPETVKIMKRRLDRIQIKIQGLAPLITHKFSEAALEKLAESGAKKTKMRSVRDPENEMCGCLYLVPGKELVDPFSKKAAKGTYGIQGVALKLSAVTSCRYLNDKSLNMTNSRGMFEVEDQIVPIHCENISMGSDTVRLPNGAAQIRYRPYFNNWHATFWVRFCPDLISAESLVNLFDMAGFHVGLGDWRPEKKGNKGTFEVVTG